MGTAVTDASVNKSCVMLLVDKICPLGADPSKGSVADTCDPDHFLPSKRWQDQLDQILAATDGGFLSLGAFQSGITMAIGHFFMAIAAFLWGLIHELAAWISSMALLSGDIGKHITRVFASMSNVLTSSGLLAILIFVTALVLIRQVLRVRGGGMPSGLIGTAMTVLLPLGVLFAMAAGASQSVTNTKDGVKSNDVDPSQVFMSPVWLAQKGIWLAEMPSAAIAKGLSDTNPAFGGDKLANPSCAAYVEVLRAAYREAWARKHPTNSKSASLTIVVDGLFNEAFMTFYNDGQFQNSFSGQRIVCHLLDGFVGISPAEQALIGAAARYPAGANAGEVKSVYLNGVPANGSAAYSDPRYFAPYTNLGANMSVDDKRKFALSWAACAYKGGNPKEASAWAVDPAWYWGTRSWEGDSDGTDPEKEAIGSYGCKRLWNDPYLVDGTTDADPGLRGDRFQILRFKGVSNGDVRGSKSNSATISKYESSLNSGRCGSDTCISKEFGVENLPGFTRTVLVTKGELGGWMFSAIMAFVAALMYSYVLVGMFGGLLLAKVGFTVLLAASPGILFLLALPNVSGRKNSRGMRLLRMLIGWMVATAVLSALVMVFALFISMIRNFLGGANGGFFYVISPAISLVLMHFLMKAVGMAGLISPTGSMGFALGAAKAASTGNLSDFKKGQSSLTNTAKKKLDSRMKKKSRNERMRNAAAKEGKSLKELKKDDDWARRNRADDLGEHLRDMWHARKGKKDFAGTSRRARFQAAKNRHKLAKTKEDEALNALEEGAKPGIAARLSRKNARRADPSAAPLLNDVNAATAGNRDAANATEDVLSDLDILTDTASSSAQAAARTAAGTGLGAAAAATSHLSAPASHAAASLLAATVSADGDGTATKELVAEAQALSLGLVSHTGAALRTVSGERVTAVMDYATGETLLPGTPEFVAAVAEMNAQRASGFDSDRVSVGGRTFQVSASETAVIGREGQSAAAQVLATEYGVDPSSVLVSRSGSLVSVTPGTGSSAYLGTGMLIAPTAAQQVEVARNVTQWLPPTVREQIMSLPASGQAAALETIVQAYSSDGQPADALSLLGVDETKIIAAHGDPAQMAALTDRHLPIPDRLVTFALAEGAAAASGAALSEEHRVAVYDLGEKGGRALQKADEVMLRLGTMPLAARDASLPQVDAEARIREITNVLAEFTVARTAAATVSSAAIGDSVTAHAMTEKVITEQRDIVMKIEADYASALAEPDTAVRERKLTAVVREATEQIVTVHRIAGREHDASTEKLLESLGATGSRAARFEAMSTPVPIIAAQVGVSARHARGLPGRVVRRASWS